VVKLKIPILGGILAKTAIARFTRTLGTLISAGVPILDALNITKETCGNEVYSRALVKVHDAIREGESMADPLRATKVCDAMVVNMIDVGEETGDLDKMLMKIADNYDSDVDVLVGSLISILEPVMVVVLGVIVGFIVIALFMPMIYYDEVRVRDAWGSPIVFMTHMHPAIGMTSKGWFFFSAGPDRQYLTRDDNLYSYDQPVIQP
jgi:type IV pilus assembly protein PilC